ncbi:G-type lectin S-receptor-like serine/threonine-protein kinase At4g27290 [Bidens hawaiensis]|uniref:G-type lectin S-receptor-like serine/threonine-protein kinase At4g27290 n=1 Tax=Bidens hawaiensis TaxID=980011 RepID=UPI004049FDFB
MLLPPITLFFLFLTTSRSSDTIAVHQNISDGQTIVSGNGKFELGFFSPGRSKNRYLGIWFKNTSPQTVAWVANRETPLIDTSGVVKLDNQGNLTLVNGSGKVFWTSNSSSSGTNINLVAQILNNGNLVINTGNKTTDEDFIWQSFDYPGDTCLSEMKLGKNFITGRETYQTSWSSTDDPSPSEYTLRISAVKGKYQQVYIRRSSAIKTRVGPYNGITFSGRENYAPDANRASLSYVIANENEAYITFISNSNTTTLRTVLTPDGNLEILQLKFPSPEWIPIATLPADYCDNYRKCGPYGICNTATSPSCGCLKGFEPKNDTDVCRRSIPLDCGPGEGFQKLSGMKLPDTENAVFNINMSLLDCKAACKKNCSCTAYANPNNSPGRVDCLLWFGDLVDVRVFQQNGQDLYIRLAASEFSDHRSNFNTKKRVTIQVTVSIAAVLTFSGLIYAFYSRRKRTKRSDTKREGTTEKIFGNSSQIGSVEVPLYSLSEISRATNDFSVDNKLGEGGFGPVYMGVLGDGQEIAVKRLSKSSGQGLVEFENEVICIAKLQHRNLVKLLGYCIQGDEKMLIYEYMPNKSLDSFLFADESKKVLLDWPQRFHIIHGIARGLLYLHQDSRLKIVHRDLKAANILLDYQMRPKISDFGLARMFKEGESEANTKRVVGTLGYISPEYAMKGLFSIKSDIFSFGVLVLEIVSGKKNREFVHEDHDDNLLGYAWRLYKEGKSLDLIDESLRTSYSVCEVLRSVHVGLLCVQHGVEDRPDTTNVVAMLGGEGTLPSPKKPAFFTQESEIKSTSIISLISLSANGLTLSQVDGR